MQSINACYMFFISNNLKIRTSAIYYISNYKLQIYIIVNSHNILQNFLKMKIKQDVKQYFYFNFALKRLLY